MRIAQKIADRTLGMEKAVAALAAPQGGHVARQQLEPGELRRLALLIPRHPATGRLVAILALGRAEPTRRSTSSSPRRSP